MGHLRTGPLPQTRKWRQVIALIGAGADVGQVASATINAASKAFAHADEDDALIDTIWLITRLPTAARSENFAAALRDIGLDLRESPSFMDFISSFTEAVDNRVFGRGTRTDLGEMAQLAASETFSRVIGERVSGLFGKSTEDIQGELVRLGTKSQFGNFMRHYFARLIERSLDYFLSRTLSHHVGEGGRFATLSQQADFSGALSQHCSEAATIVESFASGWFSKTNFEKGGISRSDAQHFARYAMTKITDELQRRARSDGD